MTMNNLGFSITLPLVEEGCVAAADAGVPLPPPVHPDDSLDVLVIGAGQAGLSVGYFLAKAGLRFRIVDANERVGDSWRHRWDSLHLFTPAEFDGLAGMPFPALGRFEYPSKDQMADYLEHYARTMQLPVTTDTRIELLQHCDGRFIARAAGRTFAADQVIVAMATFQRPKLPAFAGELSSDIFSVHSADYRNPAQLRRGSVLVVGAGNSGAEIAAETAAAGLRTWLAGEHPGVVPIDRNSFIARHFLNRLILRGVFHRVLTIRTPMGRKHRAKFLHQGAPLVPVKPKDLARLGVERVGRVRAAKGGMPQLDDGTVLAPDNIVWCTGLGPDFRWIDIPVLDSKGFPVQHAGMVPACPGLYFVGLHYQYALSSTMVHGVGRDARRVAQAVVERAKASTVPSAAR
jgi:putative flavoprotein involved in K+ transport